MSMLPAVNVTLDKELPLTERVEIKNQISAIEGVLSASFNREATVLRVTYSGSNVQQEIKAIEGVLSIKHQL